MEQPGNRVFTDVAPAADEERGRDSMFLLANVRIAGRANELQARVRNLSAGGLMAELPDPVPHDTRVEIEVRGIGWIAGRIVWQTQGRAGIAFDHEIDPSRARKPIIPRLAATKTLTTEPRRR